MMPFTNSIANGISFGIVSYTLLALAGNLFTKNKVKIHWLMWVLTVLIIARYAFLGAE
jgi:AGZA family xanthine/uracil permease-like MFS transporter